MSKLTKKQQYMRGWYRKNRERVLREQAEWRKNNPEEAKVLDKRSYKTRAPQAREEKRLLNIQYKKDILTHYSGDKPCCGNCGFSDIRALEVDHINNDGAEHRKEVCGGKRGGMAMYRWIIKNKFPDTFQILCSNCNRIKQRELCGDTISSYRT